MTPEADIRADSLKAGVTIVRKPAPVLRPQDVGSIDDRLEELGVFYKDTDFEKAILLPLELYDDLAFAFKRPDEWRQQGFPLKARALRRQVLGRDAESGKVHYGPGSFQECAVIRLVEAGEDEPVHGRGEVSQFGVKLAS